MIRGLRRMISIAIPTLALVSCQSMELQLSLLVPENVDPRRVDLSRAAEGATVEVSRDTPIVLLFPVNETNLAEMVTAATGGRDDVVLVDVEVRRSFWWAVLFGNVNRQMRAVCVPLPAQADVQQEAER